MLSRVQTFCCPTCGNLIGEAQPIERLVDCDLSRQQRQIIDVLTINVGAWVSVQTIERALWEDKSSAAVRNPSAQAISAQISKMQPIIRATGWFVNSDRRGHYQLIPIERGAA